MRSSRTSKLISGEKKSEQWLSEMRGELTEKGHEGTFWETESS